MSGSPKYSQPSLDPEVEQRLAAERRAQADAAEEARRIAREKAVARRVADLREEVRGDSARLASQINSLVGSSVAQWLDAEFKVAQERHRKIEANVETFTTITALQKAKQSLSDLTTQVSSCESRASAEALADRLRREQGEKLGRIASLLGAVQSSIDTVSESVRIRFDPDGARVIEENFLRIERMRATDLLDETIQLLGSTVAIADGHVSIVSRASVEHESARAAAEERYANSSNLLQGLLADKVVAMWSQKRLVEISDHLAQARAALGREDFGRAVELAISVDSEGEQAVIEAQSRQLQEERRGYIVGGISRALRAQGFQVAMPQLLRVGDFESEVVIRTSREGGNIWLETKVPVEGAVAYDVKGMEHRSQMGEGGVILVCDDTESMLVRFHQELATLGIDMGELYWSGKDPKRIGRIENELPISGPAVGRSARR